MARTWRAWAAAALVAIGVLRIVLTYDDLSETVDEAAHIVAGMEWLVLKRFTFEPKHPPVPRVAAAIGPYLLGIRMRDQPDLESVGRQVLYADGEYLRNLTAARLGILPFFVLAGFFVWRIASSLFGPTVALGTVTSFTLLPPVLAHFGIATTDGPLTAMFAAAVFAMLTWIRGPTIARGLAVGVAVGLAFVTKMSALPYLGVFGVLLMASYMWSWRGQHRAALAQTVPGQAGGQASALVTPAVETSAWSWGKALASFAVAAVAAFVIMWAVYRFSVGTIRGLTIPLPEFVRGVRELADHNSRGHPTYFLGEFRWTGVWYYFPVVLALKTPLAALLLGGAGLGLLVRKARRTVDWRPLVPLLIVVAILVVAMPARINIGLRHVLPIYVALAIAIGVAWDRAWNSARSRRARSALIAGTAALSIGTVTIHPDYLSYFNVLAGREPSRLVAGSDHEWAQDLLRLARVVRQRGIDSLTLAYIGTEDPSPIVGVPVRFWGGRERPTGWVAVGETIYRMGPIGVRDDGYFNVPNAFSWLDSVATYTRVGKGIRLYHVPAAPGAAGSDR